mgnify:CR=1 FL=1
MHAIAHRLGTRNGAPYGLVNALPLAPILSRCNQAALPWQPVLTRRAGLAQNGDGEAALAPRFIARVEALNAAIGIALQLPAPRAADAPERARADSAGASAS